MPSPCKPKVTDLDEGRLLTIKQGIVQLHVTALASPVSTMQSRPQAWCRIARTRWLGQLRLFVSLLTDELCDADGSS